MKKSPGTGRLFILDTSYLLHTEKIHSSAEIRHGLQLGRVFFSDDQMREGRAGLFKMNPPLRSRTDVDALLEGIADGTLSILCSDHAPHE